MTPSLKTNLLNAIDAVMAEQWSGTKAQLGALSQLVLTAYEASEQLENPTPLINNEINPLSLPVPD